MAMVSAPDAGRRLELAIAAAQRWRRRGQDRAETTRAIDRGELPAEEDPNRLRARIERLVAWGRVAAGRLGESAVTATQGLEAGRAIAAAAAAAETPAPLAEKARTLERIINQTRDLLSVEFLEIGLDVARSVGRITYMGQATGTGVLVAPGVIMTNNHVLDSVESAEAADFELDYEPNLFGAAKSVQSFRLQPRRFFFTSRELDYTIVAVIDRSHRGADIEDYGYRPLIAQDGKIMKGEPVNIIGHPAGQPKQVVVRDSYLVDLPNIDNADFYFHYTGDTEKGSSGSPVFNDQWEMVALHHSGIPKTTDDGNLVAKNGQVIQAVRDPNGVIANLDQLEDQIEWEANEGIRVSRIVRNFREIVIEDPNAGAMRDRILNLWQEAGRPGAQQVAVTIYSSGPAPGTGAPPERRGTTARESATVAPGAIGTTGGRQLQSRDGGAQAATVVPIGRRGVDLEIPLRIRIDLGEPREP